MAGDTVTLDQTEQGVLIVAERSEHDRQLELGRALIQKYRKTFEALAK